jgi:hypothetical protein
MNEEQMKEQLVVELRHLVGSFVLRLLAHL